MDEMRIADASSFSRYCWKKCMISLAVRQTVKYSHYMKLKNKIELIVTFRIDLDIEPLILVYEQREILN